MVDFRQCIAVKLKNLKTEPHKADETMCSLYSIAYIYTVSGYITPAMITYSRLTPIQVTSMRLD